MYESHFIMMAAAPVVRTPFLITPCSTLRDAGCARTRYVISLCTWALASCVVAGSIELSNVTVTSPSLLKSPPLIEISQAPIAARVESHRYSASSGGCGGGEPLYAGMQPMAWKSRLLTPFSCVSGSSYEPGDAAPFASRLNP